MTTDHDPRIGTAIESLGAPPPRPGFHERLWARIDAAERAESRPRRRFARRPLMVLTAATAVAVVCAVIAVMGRTGRDELLPVGAPPAAAGVLEKMKASMGSYQTLSAVFYYTRSTGSLPQALAADAAAGRASQTRLEKGLRIVPAARPLLRARVLATSTGCMRTWSAQAPDGSWVVPKEGATVWNTPGLHVQVRNVPQGFAYEMWLADGRVQVRRALGTAPGPPDATSAGWFPGTYGGQVSPLAFTPGVVRVISYRGRQALAVDTAVTPRPIGVDEAGVVTTLPFDHVEMIVDRATWLPVRIARTYRGAVVEAWGFDDLRLNVPVDDAAFGDALPRGADVQDSDAGFQRLPSLAEAARAVHGEVFVPTRLPSGFTLRLVAERAGSSALPTASPAGDVTLSGAQDERATDVVSLVYRRGFRRIVVTTRSTAAGGTADPFSGSVWSAPGHEDARQVTLAGGRLAGEVAHVVTGTFELPRLWVCDGHTLVTVAGDVSRGELLALGGSLQPWAIAETQKVFDRYRIATMKDDREALAGLFADGVVLNDRSALTALHNRSAVLQRNSDYCAAFTDGTTISALTGRGWMLWEGWEPDVLSDDTGTASAELIHVRDGLIVSEDFSILDGARRPATLSRHPRDTVAGAARVAARYAASLVAKRPGPLAAQAAPGVRFTDVSFGDRGGAGVLRRRYERMFGRPADLAFSGVSWFAGPGWAVVRWMATSPSLGARAAGLTVLETSHGTVVRETVYCSRFKAPFD